MYLDVDLILFDLLLCLFIRESNTVTMGILEGGNFG